MYYRNLSVSSKIIEPALNMPESHHLTWCMVKSGFMVVLDHTFNPAMYSTKYLWHGIVTL